MMASLLKHTNTMHSVPKKVTKRKSNAVPEVIVNNKVKKNEVKVKKSATKAELFLQIESLEQKYDALEKEHNRNIDKIKSLEMKICK
jgi:chaperonin cofactor prefoldin